MRALGTLTLASILALSWGCAGRKAPEAEPTPAPAAEPAAVEEVKNTMVVIKTNLGDIEVELFDEQAPITVENFLRYADEGHYDGTIFHRVIKGFMIQGGGFDQNMSQKPTHDPIKNEADNGLKNEPGTLAMARTSVVDSATSQFFINVKENSFLDHGSRDFGYAVFGRVSSGMEVVTQIENVATTSQGPMRDVPAEPVIIESISRK
jgi:cyclophilin family peptidyl-prolyl cis-trans isomerase